MNEEEWLTCTDPELLLKFLWSRMRMMPTCMAPVLFGRPTRRNQPWGMGSCSLMPALDLQGQAQPS